MANIKKKVRILKKYPIDESWLPKNKQALLSFMAKYPVRKKPAIRLSFWERSRIILSNPIKSLQLISKPMISLIIIGALLLGGGGVVAAAQNDLPTDPLYGVKIASENARKSLVFSDEAKTELETKFAERRLMEIEKLSEIAAQSPADEEKSAKGIEIAIDRLKKSAEKLENNAEKIIARKNAQAIESVRQKFSEHLVKFEEAETRIKFNPPGLKKAYEAIAKAEMGMEQVEINTESDESKKYEAAQGKIKAAENKIREVKEYFAKIEQELTEEQDNAFLEAKQKLSEAETILEEAKKILPDTPLLAFEKANSALRQAQLAKMSLPKKKPMPAILLEKASQEIKLKIEEKILKKENQNNEITNDDAEEEEVEKTEDENNEDLTNEKQNKISEQGQPNIERQNSVPQIKANESGENATGRSQENE